MIDFIALLIKQALCVAGNFLLGIVNPVCVKMFGPGLQPSSRLLDQGNGIDQWHGGLGIMNIRAGMDQRD